LVIRKAASLGISVLLVQGRTGNVWLWGGALLVLLGTVMYSMDGARQQKRVQPKEQEKEGKEGTFKEE